MKHIDYYKNLIPQFVNQTQAYRDEMIGQLKNIEADLLQCKLEIAS